MAPINAENGTLRLTVDQDKGLVAFHLEHGGGASWDLGLRGMVGCDIGPGFRGGVGGLRQWLDWLRAKLGRWRLGLEDSGGPDIGCRC